jgi:hypothetical protein
MSYGQGKSGFDEWMASDEQKLFFYVKDADEYLRKISTIEMPVMVFEWKDDQEFVKAISANKLSTSLIYNDPRGIFLGKERILNKLVGDGMDWVPKTVFSMEDAKDQLTFPVIAKSRNSYDSKGVEKVDNRQDLSKFEKYDIFQNMIDIDREFRVIVFKGKRFDRTTKVLMILEKMPKNDKAKGLRVDEELSKEELKEKGNTKFKWKQLDIEKFEHMDSLKKILPYLMNVNPSLNMTGLDMAVDKEGKMWYIEHNLQPAMFSNQGILIYKCIFEDYYGKKMSEKSRTMMLDMSKQYYKKTAENFPFELENEKLLENLDGEEV